MYVCAWGFLTTDVRTERKKPRDDGEERILIFTLINILQIVFNFTVLTQGEINFCHGMADRCAQEPPGSPVANCAYHFLYITHCVIYTRRGLRRYYNIREDPRERQMCATHRPVVVIRLNEKYSFFCLSPEWRFIRRRAVFIVRPPILIYAYFRQCSVREKCV